MGSSISRTRRTKLRNENFYFERRGDSARAEEMRIERGNGEQDMIDEAGPRY